jgi:hypothetical protein
VKRKEISDLILPFRKWYFNMTCGRDRNASRVFEKEYAWSHGEDTDLFFMAFVAGYDQKAKEGERRL